jgi:hypothetical protein
VIEKVVLRPTLFVTLAAGLAASVASTPARAQDDRLDRAMKPRRKLCRRRDEARPDRPH